MTEDRFMRVCLVMPPGPVPRFDCAIVVGEPVNGMVELAEELTWGDREVRSIPAQACWDFDADLMHAVNNLTGRVMDDVDAASKIVIANGKPAFMTPIQTPSVLH